MSESEPIPRFSSEPSRDKVLDAWVKLASAATDSGGAAFPITVVVGGTIISGWLIGAETYFRRMAVNLGVAELDPDTHFPELVGLWVDDARIETDAESFTPEFIHLDRAVPVIGGATIDSEGMMMRIRMSEVQGFALAQMSSARKPG